MSEEYGEFDLGEVFSWNFFKWANASDSSSNNDNDDDTSNSSSSSSSLDPVLCEICKKADGNIMTAYENVQEHIDETARRGTRTHGIVENIVTSAFMCSKCDKFRRR